MQLSSHEQLPGPLPSALEDDLVHRLEELDTSGTRSSFPLKTPRDYLNRGSELLNDDDARAAYDLTLSGWQIVEKSLSTDSLPPQETVTLEYLSALVDRAWRAERPKDAERWHEERLRLLRDQGRSSQAERESLLGPCLHRDPQEHETPLLKRIAQALVSNHLQGSEPAPGDAEILLTWGQHLCRQGRYNQALDPLKLSAELWSALDQAELWCAAQLSLADAYIHVGDEENARELIREILDTTSNRAVRATLLFTRSRLNFGSSAHRDAALLDLMSALEIFTDAGMREPATVSALFLAQQADESHSARLNVLALEKALEHAQRSESHRSTSISIELAEAYLQTDETEQAKDLLLPVTLAPEPQHAPAFLERAKAFALLGQAQLRSEQHEKALASWERACRLFASGEDGLQAAQAAASVALSYTNMNQPESSKIWAERAVQLCEQFQVHPLATANTMNILARILGRSGDPEALEIIDDCLRIAQDFELDPLIAAFLETKATILMHLDRTDEAVATALESGDLYLASGEAAAGAASDLLAAQCLMAEERYVEAASIYRSAIDKHPDEAGCLSRAYEGLSRVLGRLGQKREATEAAESAKHWELREIQAEGR